MRLPYSLESNGLSMVKQGVRIASGGRKPTHSADFPLPQQLDRDGVPRVALQQSLERADAFR